MGIVSGQFTEVKGLDVVEFRAKHELSLMKGIHVTFFADTIFSASSNTRYQGVKFKSSIGMVNHASVMCLDAHPQH